VRIDLQGLYRANPKAFVAAGAVIGACFVVLLVKGISGTSSRQNTPAAQTTTLATSTNRTTVAQSGVTTPDPNFHPSYVAAQDTAANQKFAAGMASETSALAAAEALTPPPAAWTTEYPAVPAASLRDPESYAIAFVTELLTTNYRTQSRTSLESWIQAEAAALMLPGIPTNAAEKALYGDLFDGATVSNGPSPIATAAGWAASAKAGASQRVYYVTANPDATWANAVSNGVTSTDPLLTEVDVKGTLATRTGRKTASQHFSLVLCVGSALHHSGLGACSLNNWGAN
jgi:hypothetical protein